MSAFHFSFIISQKVIGIIISSLLRPLTLSDTHFFYSYSNLIFCIVCVFSRDIQVCEMFYGTDFQSKCMLSKYSSQISCHSHRRGQQLLGGSYTPNDTMVDQSYNRFKEPQNKKAWIWRTWYVTEKRRIQETLWKFVLIKILDFLVVGVI